MNTPPLKIALAGAKGRLGREICQAMAKGNDFVLVQELGRGDVLAPGFDLLLDVSTAAGMIDHLALCAGFGKPMVIGVTGLNAPQQDQIRETAKTIPILQTGNFSIAINQFLDQARRTAKELGMTWSARIEEIHHTGKKDYPSGTALMLAAQVQAGFGHERIIKPVLWPQNPESATPEIFPILSRREEKIIGQHILVFEKSGEKVVLGHTAHQRSIFADGAVVAAKWLAEKPAGSYEMSDVLDKDVGATTRQHLA